MKHWKKRLFTAAALVAALPIALGQSAPVAAPVETRAVKSSSKADAPTPADRAYLGVYPGTDSEGGGVKLEQVVDGSPAEKAGLQSGDVITAFGDRTVGSDEELRSAIASHQSGEKVKITYLRDGGKRRTSVRLGKAPSEVEAGGNEEVAAEHAEKSAKAEKVEKAAKAESADKAAKAESVEKSAKSGAKGGGGLVQVAPAKGVDEDAGYMGVTLAPTGDGRTSVSTVVDGSPAQKAGMQSGDVILKIDGEEAESADEVVGLVTKHHAGDKVTVTVERDGKSQKIKVKLSARSAANLGSAGSVGGLAAPVPSNPEPKSVPVAPRAAKPRGRADAASTGDAGSPDAMRKEVEGMRVELEHMRKSMDELKQKCESQQRTIEKIKHALDGNDEPGSLSYGGSVASMGGATTAVALPSELAKPATAAVATPDGGGAFVVDGGQGGKPMVIQLDGDEPIHDNVKVIHVRPQAGGQTIRLDGGDDPNVVNGKVIHVKPQGGGQTIQLVIDDGEGDEAAEGDEGGGESCCAVGENGTVAKKVVVVHGAPGKYTEITKLGGDAQVRGKVVHVAPVHGGLGGGGAMKVAQNPNGVTVYGRVADDKSEGGCCGGCGCCKEHAAAHAGVGSGAPGMGMGGMPGGGTFELVPVGPGGDERPMRARMHPAPGMPMPPAAPMAPRGPMKFQMKAPPPQPFPQMAGGGTMVWKCDGPCELTFNSNGAQFRCEGSCEISQSSDLADATAAFEVDDSSGDVDLFAEDAGNASLMFSADGEGSDSEDADEDGESSQDCEGCEHEGSCAIGYTQSGDGDSEHEDGDEDDDQGDDGDDDAPAATPASIALPAI